MNPRQKNPTLSLRPQFERVLLWILHSPLRITSAVVAFGVSASVIEGVVDITARSLRAPPRVQGLVDAVVLGVCAAIFALLVLTAARHLRMIAELNHQVRNALQVIVYGEYSPDKHSHRSAVLAGVEKIQDALRELFPLVGERTDDRPWEAHNQRHFPGKNMIRERRGPSR
jgi:hypothetical protein